MVYILGVWFPKRRLVYLGALILYFAISKTLFDKIFATSHIVIDELFHIPQGKVFCAGNYSHYDPKITTPPGLYVITTTHLGNMFFSCNIYNLRFANLMGSCFNFLIIMFLLILIYGRGLDIYLLMAQVFTLSTLPPLYFFSFVYYTDVWSLTFLLLYSAVSSLNNRHMFIISFGITAIAMRQTNIAWVIMFFGHKCLEVFIKSSRVFGNRNLTSVQLGENSLIGRDTDTSKLKRHYEFEDFWIALKYHSGTYLTTFFKYVTLRDAKTIASHLFIILTFATFLVFNGSVAFGDKQAHEVTIHIPQLFYFLLFYGFFGLPFVLSKVPDTLSLIFRNKTRVLLIALLMLAIVHVNTLVHPYLLADNRHYTFYIWNRWYGKYNFARYVMVPIYTFLLLNLYENLRKHNCVSLLISFCVSIFISLCFQKMIEIRYFLVPYMICRLRFRPPTYKYVILEFLWYSIINVAFFYVFFTKEIKWENFEQMQRIIW
ncbi:putative Dol-P-Glc:Glc(2)Man(9)GlcNAc(2)-PP-Dol alpha-1,2-glucosyltransferase [Ostrinia furnacalis]|uniref:putative Dol-P-Glc:Glc(2)Man(9)GlcNAc(2)-PP-Dol alpha-1,2-glucosyltransferase n=1 Tax=Ostrinia furnacalis TaxID=93504 RepID=UPI001039F210|nr:putative Dol-P-Glc:Glc(2)Man(9)GlcNAc(2)-PP-Dol alpha-1,2-glucosyltransferase [Ostrinia furnacalis]